MGAGNWYDGDIERVVITEEQLRERIDDLAKQVAADYSGHDSVLLVGVLKGAFVFMADFARALGRQSRPVEIEFMAISSYGQRATSSGVVRILKDLDRDIANRHVVVVEDIVDSGLTAVVAAEVPGQPIGRVGRGGHPAAQAGRGEGRRTCPLCRL
jgi:hypoxanthine phosphoribosyltransferase